MSKIRQAFIPTDTARGKMIKLLLSAAPFCDSCHLARPEAVPVTAGEPLVSGERAAEALTPGGDLGLSPPLAFFILSLFGGSVSVANLEPPGIRLTIALKDASSGRAI